MKQKAFGENGAILGAAALAISRAIMIYGDPKRVRDQLLECFALGVGAAIAHDDRFGGKDEIAVAVARVSVQIREAVMTCRRYDEVNDRTFLADVFEDELPWRSRAI